MMFYNKTQRSTIQIQRQKGKFEINPQTFTAKSKGEETGDLIYINLH